MTEQVINWLIKTDIAIAISFILLMLTIWQAHKQQQKSQEDGIRLREKELRESIRYRQSLEQQQKLQAQKQDFQEGQITQILDWISQFTLSRKE